MMENFRLYTTLAWNDLGRNFLPRYFLARFFPLKLIQSVGYFVFWNLPYLLLKVKWLAPHRLYSWRILVRAADWTMFIFPLVFHWACVCVCVCGGGRGGGGEGHDPCLFPLHWLPFNKPLKQFSVCLDLFWTIVLLLRICNFPTKVFVFRFLSD